MNGNITTAPLGGNRNIKTKPLYQYDYGQILKIIGIDLPMAYEVHFSNELHGVATTQIGNANGVVIPDIYLTTGLPVYVWLYLHTGETDGETEYTITIPVVQRASISDQEPTPVQQDVITQAIAALNTAVEQTAQDVQDATEAKEDAEEAAGNAYESAVAAAQSAANAGTYAGQAQSAQTASELAQQKAEEAQTGAQTAKWAAESAQTAAEAAQAGAVAARTGAETAQAWAVAARSGAEAAQHAAEAARDEITGMSATANTLPAGSQAAASYADGTLTLGIPQGAKGDTGDTGATPDLTIGTVQTLPAGSSATATITGTAEDPVLNLGIPKGDPGEVTQAEFDALADDVSDMQDTLEHKADIDGYYTDMTVGNAEQLVSSQYVEDAEPYKFRTSGGSADIGNREYLDKIVGGTVAWNQQVRDEASKNQTDYADVVTVTDAVVDDAAVKVAVEPVQDLHGYDSPWPAGGGKNKINYLSCIGVGARNGTDSVYGNNTSISGTELTINQAYGDNGGILKGIGTFPLATGEYVTISGKATLIDTSYLTVGISNYDGGGTNNINSSVAVINGRFSVTLNAKSDYAKTGIFLQPQTARSTAVVSDVMVAFGQTEQPYSPYANLCPISGWDEVKVYDDQRYGGLVEWNQLINPANYRTVTTAGITTTISGNNIIANGTATATAYIALLTTPAPTVAGHKYLSIIPSDTETIYYDDASPRQYQGKTDPFFFVGSGNSISAHTRINSGVTVADKIICQQLFDLTAMFGAGNEPSTVEEFRSLFPASYYAYNAGGTLMTVGQVNGEAYRAYTITLPQTVYNGIIESDGGESRAALRRITAFSGAWGATANGYAVYAVVTGGTRTSDANLAMCDKFKLSGSSYVNMPLYSWSGGSGVNETFTFVLPSTVTSLAEANQWIADNGGYIEFTYKLATPTEFAIATPPQVQTLLGTNHVWSDAGQVALTYTGTDEHLILTTGRKYMTRISGTDSVILGAGQTVTAAKGQDNVFDLTQMLGTAVADYVYQQGAGYFRRWFGGSHYVYNAGELLSVEGLQSHDTVGFNQWDEQWELGGFYTATGLPWATSDRIRSKNFIPVVPNMTYYICVPNGSNTTILLYDSGQNFIAGSSAAKFNTTFTVPENAAYMKFNTGSAYGNTYKGDICINLSHNGSRNGEYQPYEKHSYPLDSTLTLRGIPKVGSNGVYWDGDEYGYDGAVKRRYGVVDLGTLDWSYTSAGQRFDGVTVSNLSSSRTACFCKLYSASNVDAGWSNSDKVCCIYNTRNTIMIKDSAYTNAAAFKSAMQGVYLIYELATPTTETATPYQHIQSVDDWGTEEFVSGTITPVGHESRYPQNLRDKLQHLPALASANGSYLITQTDGQMVLSPFPAPPTAAGNYLLKATVSGGNATYSWVAQ